MIRVLKSRSIRGFKTLIRGLANTVMAKQLRKPQTATTVTKEKKPISIYEPRRSTHQCIYKTISIARVFLSFFSGTISSLAYLHSATTKTRPRPSASTHYLLRWPSAERLSAPAQRRKTPALLRTSPCLSGLVQVERARPVFNDSGDVISTHPSFQSCLCRNNTSVHRLESRAGPWPLFRPSELAVCVLPSEATRNRNTTEGTREHGLLHIYSAVAVHCVCAVLQSDSR